MTHITTVGPIIVLYRQTTAKVMSTSSGDLNIIILTAIDTMSIE